MSETFFTEEPLYADDDRSITQVTLCGMGPAVVNRGSDSTYKIIEGTGFFRVLYSKTWKTQVTEVRPGDSIVIPRDNVYAPYTEIGTLVMQVTHTPPYNEEQVRIVREIEK